MKRAVEKWRGTSPSGTARVHKPRTGPRRTLPLEPPPRPLEQRKAPPYAMSRVLARWRELAHADIDAQLLAPVPELYDHEPWAAEWAAELEHARWW